MGNRREKCKLAALKLFFSRHILQKHGICIFQFVQGRRQPSGKLIQIAGQHPDFIRSFFPALNTEIQRRQLFRHFGDAEHRAGDIS